MLPAINYPIPNQDSTRITTPKYPIFPPLLAKWTAGYKPFIDDNVFK